MNSYGWTAIIYTFYHFGLTGIEVLEMLVEAGMDHTHRDLYGWNILHFAAWSCDYEKVKYLIEFGMDKKVKGNYNETALDIAKTYECKDHVDDWKAFKKLLN